VGSYGSGVVRLFDDTLVYSHSVSVSYGYDT